MESTDVFQETGQYLRALNDNNLDDTNAKIFSSHWDVNDPDSILISHQNGRLQIINTKDINSTSSNYHVYLEPYSNDIDYGHRSKFLASGKKLIIHWDKLLTIPGKPNEIIFVLGVSKSICHAYLPFIHDPDAYTRGTIVTELHQHKSRVISLTISHNGTLMASGDEQGGISLQVLQIPQNSYTLLESFENSRKSKFLRQEEERSERESNTSKSFSGLNAVEDPNEFKLTYHDTNKENGPIFCLQFLPNVVTKHANKSASKQANTSVTLGGPDLTLSDAGRGLLVKPTDQTDQDHYFMVSGSMDGFLRIWCVQMSVGSFKSACLSLTPFIKLNTINTNVLSLNVCPSFNINVCDSQPPATVSAIPVDGSHSLSDTQSSLSTSSQSKYNHNKIRSKRNAMDPDFDAMPPPTEVFYLVAGTSAGVVYMWKIPRIFLHTSIMNRFNPKVSVVRSDVSMLCGLVQVSDRAIIQLALAASPTAAAAPTAAVETKTAVTATEAHQNPFPIIDTSLLHTHTAGGGHGVVDQSAAPLILAAADANGILHVFCEIEAPPTIDSSSTSAPPMTDFNPITATAATVSSSSEGALMKQLLRRDNSSLTATTTTTVTALTALKSSAVSSRPSLSSSSHAKAAETAAANAVAKSSSKIPVLKNLSAELQQQAAEESLVFATAATRDFIPCAQAEYSTPVVSCAFNNKGSATTTSSSSDPLVLSPFTSSAGVDPVLSLCTYSGDLGFYTSSSLFALMRQEQLPSSLNDSPLRAPNSKGDTNTNNNDKQKTQGTIRLPLTSNVQSLAAQRSKSNSQTMASLAVVKNTVSAPTATGVLLSNHKQKSTVTEPQPAAASRARPSALKSSLKGAAVQSHTPSAEEEDECEPRALPPPPPSSLATASQLPLQSRSHPATTAATPVIPTLQNIQSFSAANPIKMHQPNAASTEQKAVVASTTGVVKSTAAESWHSTSATAAVTENHVTAHTATIKPTFDNPLTQQTAEMKNTTSVQLAVKTVKTKSGSTVPKSSTGGGGGGDGSLRFKLPVGDKTTAGTSSRRDKSAAHSQQSHSQQQQSVGSSSRDAVVQSTLGHPTIHSSQLISEEMQKLRTKLENDEVSLSTVVTTGTDRLRAAKVVNVPLYVSRYANLTSVQQADQDELIPNREKVLRNTTKQVDTEWLQRRQSGGPSLEDLAELEQSPDHPVELKFVHTNGTNNTKKMSKGQKSASISATASTSTTSFPLTTRIDPETLTPIFINELNFENIFGNIEEDSTALWNDVLQKNQLDRCNFLMSYL